MLTSLGLVLLCGLLLGKLVNLFHLPGLVGMLAAGILLGPYALDCLDGTILRISPDLLKLALVIILTRAGLSIDIRDLKKIGRPALLMCFLPATCEMLGMVLIAPPLLGMGLLDAAILGAVVAAVSPAVVVPAMVKLMEKGYGRKNSVPQLVLAGASVDDIYAVVLFAAFVSLAQGEGVFALRLVEIPLSILTGCVAGAALGFALAGLFRRVPMRDSVKVVIMVGFSLLFLGVEKEWQGRLPFSGLLAVMCLGGGILERHPVLAERLAEKYSRLWVAAEIGLFVLVGASVDIRYAYNAGGAAVAVVFGVVLFRMFGVFLCTVGTVLTFRERVFCMIAYVPKATVQAAIGGIPLALGLACGQTVLTVAVLAILITAPLGALGIELSYDNLLDRE